MVVSGQEKEESSSTIDVITEKPTDLTGPAMEKADSILSRLTLEQKAAQLIIPALYASDDFFTLRAVGNYGEKGIGGVILLKGTSEAAAMIADSLTRCSSVRPLIAIDAEWGLGMRLSDEPIYPLNSEIREGVTEDEMYDYGRTVGQQCNRIGINMVLGPVLDVAERGSFMGKRSYGPDPVRVSDLSIAYSRGLESMGVMSVAKHFPGHGSARDSHKIKPVIDRTIGQMDSIDLYPFRKFIAAGLSAVMVGHLAVPAVDPDMKPAAVSHAVITGLLIEQLGFRGLVLTDAMNMGGAEGNGADKALEAGADLILAPESTDREIRLIKRAVQDGRLTQERLDSSVRKVLFYKSLMTLRGKENTLSE